MPQLLRISPNPAPSKRQRLCEESTSECGNEHLDGYEAGRLGVHYGRYPLCTYMSGLNGAMGKLMKPGGPVAKGLSAAWGSDHVLVVARPSMDPSAGLEGYKSVTTREQRRAALALVVVDRPGKELPADDRYSWVEVPLIDVFKTDLTGMKTFDDFLATLSRNQRGQARRKIKTLHKSGLRLESGPLDSSDTQLVEQLWALYEKQGLKNGQVVTSRADFFAIHETTPGLKLVTVRDPEADGAIVAFCTIVRAGDTFISMWGGADYDHPQCKAVSAYIQTQYEAIRLAAEEPGINCIDFGASHRYMKTQQFGAAPHAVSGYIRCRNALMHKAVQLACSRAYNADGLANDP